MTPQRWRRRNGRRRRGAPNRTAMPPAKEKHEGTAARSCSVADPDMDPGYGAFLTLDTGPGIGFFRIPDLGYRIPDPRPIFLIA
jgi:hypothetical protein